MNLIVPKAFIVINLSKDVSRWKQVETQCKSYNITCLRYNAIDASAWYATSGRWDQNTERALIDRGVIVASDQWSRDPQLSSKPTVVALHMSHMSACRDGFDRFPDAQWLGVVEDDVTFLRDPSKIEVKRRGKMAQLIHLHRRALHKYGREGYVLTPSACRAMKDTLPLRRPGDLTLFGIESKIPQSTSATWYVRESRDRFGSSKFFIHFACRGTTSLQSYSNLPSYDAARIASTPLPTSFMMRNFDQDTAARIGMTHCVQWHNGSRSIWTRRQSTRTGAE